MTSAAANVELIVGDGGEEGRLGNSLLHNGCGKGSAETGCTLFVWLGDIRALISDD